MGDTPTSLRQTCCLKVRSRCYKECEYVTTVNQLITLLTLCSATISWGMIKFEDDVILGCLVGCLVGCLFALRF